jgi:hypothetical protein
MLRAIFGAIIRLRERTITRLYQSMCPFPTYLTLKFTVDLKLALEKHEKIYDSRQLALQAFGRWIMQVAPRKVVVSGSLEQISQRSVKQQFREFLVQFSIWYGICLGQHIG